jgi:hypothetical protein
MMSIMARNFRKQPVATCMAAAFVLAPPLALATTHVVNTCADDGSVGSLRQQVSAAGPGDTIDLSTAQLTCSLITLGVSEIATGVESLTLKGPTDRTVTITTSDPIRLFRHDGALALTVSNLTLSGGHDEQNPLAARGGCIASLGTVVLQYAVVSGCIAHSQYGSVRGGAISAPAVYLYHSVVSGSLASSDHNNVYGGGIYTHRLVIQSYSTVTSNTATSAFGGSTYGGGAFATYSASFYFSTLDSNHAQRGGGLYCNGGFGTSTTLHESTVSGNSASIFAGGIRTGAAAVNIYDSTIAFNSAPAFAGLISQQSVLLNSSIVARNRNTSPGSFADLYSSGGIAPTGLNNLVQTYNVVPAAGVITITSNPQLAPLAFHGGPTRTHALLATSPAVDHGNDDHSAGTDQRGFGFDRIVNGTPDIGAYERQVNDDEIFYGGFD